MNAHNGFDFSDTARKIAGKKYVEPKVDMPKLQHWREKVKTKEDIVNHYKTYYPEYPDALSYAIADVIENKAVKEWYDKNKD